MVDRSLRRSRLGTRQALPVLRRVRNGLILDGEELGDVLLPTSEIEGNPAPGDNVAVFLYADSDGRPMATRRTLRAQLGEVALLKVVSVSAVGAFLDWGAPKDLLLPFAEQRGEPGVGVPQLVKVVSDREGRPVATARLDRHLQDAAHHYRQGDRVTVIAVQPSDLGYKVVVDHRYWGLIHTAELREPLRRGQRVTGYVGRLRDDGRLGISLYPPGAAKTDELGDRIVQQLEEHGGFLPLNDKSTPEAIFSMFRCSKGAYKQALGKLYKARVIAIEADGIRRT